MYLLHMKTPRTIYPLAIPKTLFRKLCRIADRAEVSRAEQMRRYLLDGVAAEERKQAIARQMKKGTA